MLIVYGALILLSLIIVPVGVYLLFSANAPPKIEQGVALVWAPVGNLVEQDNSSIGGAVVQQFLGRHDQDTVVYNLVESLDKASSDPRIKMVFLKLDEMGAASSGQLQDLASAIDRFKKTGKKVVAWAPTYDQAQYYLASQADQVYMDPMGYVFIQGYGVYHNYYKDALDKLGIKINVFRVGEYKSFVEPFTRNDMSPQARAANRAWLDSLWTTYKDEVAPPRKLKPEDIDNYIATFDKKLTAASGDTAMVAKDAGLVDQIMPLSEVRKKMSAQVGADKDTGSFRQVNNYDYMRAVNAHAKAPRTDSKIAVVVVEGAIVDGESTRGTAGGDTIARLIAKVRRDDHASALLLRVNSPGGSIFASEEIRREVEQTRAAGKPVVVSMAGVAASGGYWISMNADKIVAQPNTITGSIGVFGIVPTFSEPLNKLGIHTDGLGTTPLSGALRPDLPLSPEVKSILQHGVDHAYSDFINRVAAARGMSPAAVDRIAQGRVWSGADAKRLGLVDQMGSMRDAVALTAKLAGLKPDDYKLQSVREAGRWDSFVGEFTPKLKLKTQLAANLRAVLPDHSALDWLLRGFNDPRGLYAVCFCEPTPANSRP